MKYELILELVSLCYLHGDADMKSRVLSVIPQLRKYKLNNYANFCEKRDLFETGGVIIVKKTSENCYNVVFTADKEQIRTMFIKRQNGEKWQIFEV